MIDKIGRRIYYMYIEKINGPEDVKKLNIEEMTALAEEMRHALLKRASIHGGHFGPNFGMVEAIIALPADALAEFRYCEESWSGCQSDP